MYWRICLFYGALLVVGFSACKETPTVEEVFIDGLDKSVLFSELTLPLSTVLYPDSVVTQNDSLLIVGRHSSPIFGEVQSTAATTLRQRDIKIFLNAQSYDSIVFALVFEHAYGKRNTPFSLVAHPLKAELETVTVLYISERTVEYDEEIEVLQSDFIFIDGETDTVQVRAKKAWADDFFAQAAEQDDFLFTYPGIVLTSAARNETLLGLDPEASSMTIYYNVTPIGDDEGETVPDTITFSLDGPRYNHYQINRSQALVKDLQRGVHTTFSDNTYAQSATGVFTAIDLAPVVAMYEDMGGFTIHIAQLRFGPLVDNSNSNTVYPTAEALRLSQPYFDPLDIRNNVRNLVNRTQPNEDSRLPGNGIEGFFFNKADKESLLFTGNVAATLQIEVLVDRDKHYWLISGEDHNNFRDIILPNNSVTLRLYYSPLK